MRIAVASDGDMVGRQFQESKWFRLYEVEGGRVIRELDVPALGEGEEALIRSLADYRANVLICGAVSGSARAALGEVGILAFGGIIGRSGAAVNAFLAGTLSSGTDASCAAEGCSGSCGETSCKNCQFKN